MSIFQRVTSSFKNLAANEKMRAGIESMSNSISVSGGTPQTVMEACRLGNYQLALKRTDGLTQTTLEYRFLRGTILYRLGRLEESMTLLDQAATMSDHNKPQLAKTYHALGLVLRDKHLMEESILCFEEALKHHPNQGCFYRGIATTYLMAGTNRAEALAKAQIAIRLDNGAQVSSPDSLDMNLCESVATLAWAAAANSKDEWEVGKLDREASALRDVTNKPVVAMVHYTFARAYQELGRLNKSIEHFEQAVKEEPQGNYGRWSKEALAASTATVSSS